MVPFEGFEDGLTGRFFLNAERPLLGRGGLFFHQPSSQGFGGWGGRSACPETIRPFQTNSISLWYMGIVRSEPSAPLLSAVAHHHERGFLAHLAGSKFRLPKSADPSSS
jgi:hypothetical protein